MSLEYFFVRFTGLKIFSVNSNWSYRKLERMPAANMGFAESLCVLASPVKKNYICCAARPEEFLNSTAFGKPWPLAASIATKMLRRFSKSLAMKTGSKKKSIGLRPANIESELSRFQQNISPSDYRFEDFINQQESMTLTTEENACS